MKIKKTREDVEKLKKDWLSDPQIWDIEATEGFEKYYSELIEFRLEEEKRRRINKIQKECNLKFRREVECLGMVGLYKMILKENFFMRIMEIKNGIQRNTLYSKMAIRILQKNTPDMR